MEIVSSIFYRLHDRLSHTGLIIIKALLLNLLIENISIGYVKSFYKDFIGLRDSNN